ncbi:MAG: formate--tetrahydrofolate ligase [Oscillospiraceae bacterium]
MKPDIQIAQEASLRPMHEVAEELGLPPESVAPYGRHKAKIDHRLLAQLAERPNGKLILVTAINPTPAGEGKTTTTIGLADALRRLGHKTAIALREPSLGPVFGLKGGAAGGGYAQVVPMEDINLHFTGDIHAIGAANNLLAAMVDNHIYQGNALGIDTRRIAWRRCMDMNDRQLRAVVDGLGGRVNGIPREDGFDITVASEVMAIFCLATDLGDLKARLGRIVVGYTADEKPVSAGQLGAAGAMAALLRDALDPNLVQTLEGTPALIHGGPFANIAHGCNSVAATSLAAKLADIVVTEAGFGADLGAEKFMDIKCRMSGLRPSAAVVVATVRALKHHGGAAKAALDTPDCAALARGAANLQRHVENLRDVFGLPVVVAVNAFPTDSREEHALLEELCAQWGVELAFSTVFQDGGSGGTALAEKVLKASAGGPRGQFAYADDAPLAEKIEAICRRVYRAAGVQFAPAAEKALAQYEAMGYGNLPVCIAKTQYSFSDDASLLGAPQGFTVQVREARLSAGAGFVVAVAGNIMTMPGLPRHPAALDIDIDADGVISGLF